MYKETGKPKMTIEKCHQRLQVCDIDEDLLPNRTAWKKIIHVADATSLGIRLSFYYHWLLLCVVLFSAHNPLYFPIRIGGSVELLDDWLSTSTIIFHYFISHFIGSNYCLAIERML